MLKTIIFASLILVAFSAFLFSSFRILKKIKLGKSENRNNKIFRRIFNTISIGFFQSKILKYKFSGLLHLTIFWGFIILFLFIIEGFLEGFIKNFSFAFLGNLYPILTLLQDFFGIVVIISSLIFLTRRIFFKPKRLQNNNRSGIEAIIILILIILVMITMFGVNSHKILIYNSAVYRPVSEFIASFYKTHNSKTTYEIFWWLHNIIILIFLNFLPYSKHFHIITSIPNVYFSNYKINSKFNVTEQLDFDNISTEYFGVRDVTDLSWKQLLDSYTCTECGRCTISCPAYISGKTLNPKNIIAKIKESLKNISISESTVNKNLIDDYITKEEIWDCTTCAACMEECPVMIEHLISIINTRRYLVMSESEFPTELYSVFRNLEKYYSPWQINPETRNNWINELTEETKTGYDNLIKLYDKKENKDYDILYWVGCLGAFDSRNKEVTKSFAKLLNFFDVKFGVLGIEEKCNGDLARRLGNEYLAQELINSNIDTFKKHNVKKIVTTCPHCYNIFKNEYLKFGIELEVYHHTEYIYKLLKLKKATINKKNKKVTYHDPCYLGRYNNKYKEVRTILNSMFNFYETERNKNRSFCCGAGGGRMFIEESKGKRINEERIQEFIKEDFNYVISSCPFCLSMLNEGIKLTNEKIQIKDIAEVLLENIK